MVTTTSSGRSFWPLRRKQKVAEAQPAPAPAPLPVQDVLLGWDIAPNDPLLAYFQHSSGAIEVSRLNLDSPALRRLKDEGVAVIVPLVSQGELVGIINLGQRRSDQEYSSDDRRLLDDLAVQAAPACAWRNWCASRSWPRSSASASRPSCAWPAPSSRRCCPRRCPPRRLGDRRPLAAGAGSQRRLL